GTRRVELERRARANRMTSAQALGVRKQKPMQPCRKELRPYQVRLVTDVCRASGDVLVEQPTGSGKTLAVVTLVGMHLGQRFTHAVIAAPQEQIEHGFVHRDYQSVAFPRCRGAAVNDIVVADDLIWAARQTQQLGS